MNTKTGREEGPHRELSHREKLFCLLYTMLPNPADAARKAGYRRAERTAAGLLLRQDIREEIHARQEEWELDAVRAGLQRLAFGSGQDAIRLLFAQSPPGEEELREMDFFNVSEIRRLNGGGMEVKFFDRARAVEQLASLNEQAGTYKSPLCDAIRDGAERLWKGGAGA